MKMSCYMLHVTHYMCGVGIRLRCGATCKSKLVCRSAALFSLCPQHTLTVVVVDVNEVFILTLSYHRSSLLLVFFSIISGPFFAPHIPFFFFPSKYLFSSQPQQNSKHSPLLFTSLTTTGMLLFLKVRSHFWVLQKFPSFRFWV
ncbi:hypothetical protein V8G54_001303 [Vigna mungo]|uniref:Uncharacterized protein n=1 Tax=Vigna mungo TaxID=3915 RepID=A0AAQ3SBN9_VIGMU